MNPNHDTNAMNPRKHRQGFTLLEATISSAILAIALFTSLTISDAATKASNRAVALATREAAVLRQMDRLRRIVVRAAASTLVATPTSNQNQYGSPEPLPEPMLDDVEYDNVSFREPVGFADGMTTYEPPIDQEPRRLGLVLDDRTGIGALVLTDGDREVELASGVTSVSFTRAGDELAIEIVTAGSGPHTSQPTTSRLLLALHAR